MTQLSNACESFKQHSLSLYSLLAAMADPSNMLQVATLISQRLLAYLYLLQQHCYAWLIIILVICWLMKSPSCHAQVVVIMSYLYSPAILGSVQVSSEKH